jgi:hypothetical protein
MKHMSRRNLSQEHARFDAISASCAGAREAFVDLPRCPLRYSSPSLAPIHGLACFVLCHVFAVICFPLLYLRYNYPTDILLGAFIGIALAALALFLRVRNPMAFCHALARSISRQLLHLCAVLSFEISILFEDTREVTQAPLVSNVGLFRQNVCAI